RGADPDEVGIVSPTGSRQGVDTGRGPRISNPRYGRLPVCAAGAVLVLVLGILTWRQCGMYSNLENLWRTTLERNPKSFMAHNNLGAILLSQGHMEEAIVHFEEALGILSDNANAHGNLGNALLQQG